MKYLLKDIQIFEGTNSRGKYHWMQGVLFNDKNVRMNGERRMYYSTSEDECMLYLNANVCVKNAENSTNAVTVFDVNDASLKEAMNPGGALEDYGDIRHVNAVKVTWPLNGVWAQKYRQDVVENGVLVHKKGDLRMSETGQIMEFRELSFYLATDIDEDTNDRIYSQDPQTVANRILERGYIKLDGEQVQVQTAPIAPKAPEQPAEAPKAPEQPAEAPKAPEQPAEAPKAPEQPAEATEDLEAQIKALQEQLKGNK